MKGFFSNLKLGKKMLLAPGVIFLFMMFIACGTYMAVALQSKSMDDMYNKCFRGYQNSSHILVEMSVVQAKLYKIMVWLASNYDKKRIEDLAKHTDTQINETVKFTERVLHMKELTPEEKKYYQAAYNNLIEYQKYAKSTLEIASQDSSTAVMTFGMAEDKYFILDKSLRSVNALEDRLSRDKYESARKTVKTTLAVFIVFLVFAAVFSLLTSVSVTKLILAPIRKTIMTLQLMAEGDLTQKISFHTQDEIGDLIRSVNIMCGKMNEAVGQALQVSAVLKDSASEEAASIEESSASLDEIASMTRQNADNTIQARQLMLAVKETVLKANISMDQLTKSIREIEKSSEQTQMIVKLIDEIAFQTNLLALNASVEAARAGEVGSGFAVVADEVRSLAKRAKESANDSTIFIDDIVQKVKEGKNFVKITNKAFDDVTAGSAKVMEIVDEIAASSREQAQGINQINAAIAEMSNSTQQTAGNAEALSSVMTIFKTENNIEKSMYLSE